MWPFCPFPVNFWPLRELFSPFTLIETWSVENPRIVSIECIMHRSVALDSAIILFQCHDDDQTFVAD